MRALSALVVLATALFALTNALRFGPFKSFLKTYDAQADADALAFFGTVSLHGAIPDAQLFAEDTGSDDGETVNVATQFAEVPLPEGRNVVLGPPKFPRNVIEASLKPYCEYTTTSWNATCAERCGAIPSCLSYYFFEGTNSGQPKLPYWFCYALKVGLVTSDFKPEIQANFAHAFNRVLLD